MHYDSPPRPQRSGFAQPSTYHVNKQAFLFDTVLISLVKPSIVIMTNFPLLTTFWPLVKFYQITGCFPLEKSESQYFRPMGTQKYLLRYFITCIISNTALILSVLPMGFVEVLKIEANFTTSLIDLGAFLFSILAMLGLCTG